MKSARKSTPAIRRLPAVEILDRLEPAYGPCSGFDDACADAARWSPSDGHVPRGFVGATARLDDVLLVLLTAEPGDPHLDSRFDRLRPRSIVANAVADTYRCFRDEVDQFHRNIRVILDLAFPGLSFNDQLDRVWITNTYLCSAREEAGHVPNAAAAACGDTYLKPMLALLSNRPVIALGGKAYNRAKRLRHAVPDLLDNLYRAYAASPPGCNMPEAKPSWRAAVNDAKRHMPYE